MQIAAAATDWRLFLGLWPSPGAREAIVAHAAGWHWPDTARRTAPERLHATLHFIGNVAPARVPGLQEALRVPWSGCDIELDRAEVWPGGIAVLEASGVPPELAQLHARLAEALRALDLPVETRRFRPHVTLARKAQGARPGGVPRIGWRADPPYVLVRSLPGGAGYQPLQVFG